MECLSGRLPLTPSSDLARDWPESRCHTETERGLCFTSVTTSTSGAAVVTVGCWPPHLAGLAWYGVPQCKNEVNKLLCLCKESLCNDSSNMPEFRENIPEFGLVQGLVLISIVLLLLFTLLALTSSLVARYRRRSRGRQSADLKLEAALPPPVTRMCSAPASLSSDLVTRQPHQQRLNTTLRGSLENLLKPILKSSRLLSSEKSFSKTKKRVVLETEV